MSALIPAYLLLCIVLGGASAVGFIPNMLLQLLAIPILWFALRVDDDGTRPRPGRTLLWLAALTIAIFIVQLIPLPPPLWTTLTNRAYVADGLEMLGVDLPWLPISLTPRTTLQSLLWLLPAFAALFGIVRLGAFRVVWIAWLLAGMAVVSTLIGAAQLLGGTTSPSNFYAYSNPGVANGFFTNANHLATLLLVTVPFLAALVADSRRERRGRSAAIVIVAAATMLIVIVGIALSGSLAGIGLGIPVVVVSMLLVRADGRAIPAWGLIAVLVLAAGSVAVVLSQPFGNNLTERTARDDTLSRYTSFSRTYAAAKDYFPIGSGVGSFLPVYQQYEDPAKTITTYVNHAHNDLLEIALETGLPGLLVFAAFVVWWVRRVVSAWFDADSSPFLRAATIASGAVLAHSMVDYPLRTAAISALFATCVALMTKPRERTVGEHRRNERTARHLVA